MPSPETDIVPGPARAIQYTGSNSADIATQVPGVTITSEASGVLTLNGGQHVLATNDWIWWNASNLSTLNPTQYAAEWLCVASCTQLSGLEGEVQAATSYGAVRAMGMAAVPTLLLGQDTTVNVDIQPAMPDTGYSAYATTFGGVNLGDLDVTSVSVVDTNTVAVAVDNVGLGTISGVMLMVHAVD